MRSTRRCAVWRNKMDNILEVKNLKISFRTSSGILKAVRNISFNLKRGETLAIVGESGSGKSVTSKAILGILAGNSIVESGEILYDGRDMLKISEEEMCKIRGDKISMIFQDPLSSLDPIVKIGRQITEAMLLKNKTNRKRARAEFNSMLECLKQNMTEAAESHPEIDAAKIPEMIETFDGFNILAIKLENAYNLSSNYAEGLLSDIKDFVFRASKKQRVEVKKTLLEFVSILKLVKNPFFSAGADGEIDTLCNEIALERKAYTVAKDENGVAQPYLLSDRLLSALERTEQLLERLLAAEKPNFFRIGYYLLRNPEASLDYRDIAGVNQMALEYLNREYMEEFISYEELAIRHSYVSSLAKKREALSVLDGVRKYFSSERLIPAEAKAEVKRAVDAVENAIDRLEYIKDNVAYTFGGSLQSAVDKYFRYESLNPKEEKRYEKQSARREALVARGKKVDWRVAPKNVYDLDELRAEIISVIDRIAAVYNRALDAEGERDIHAHAVGLIDYLKGRASEVVYRVTKRMARDKAIKLMEEVGIPDARIRFKQYPFEFSGGMRQRIVIAIALAANPDVLICDEPTTALDVTIQAQILELINKLKRERNLSVIFITHDLGVVANMADRIAVMYAGKIVEEGTSEDVFYDPRHPYTWALLSSMPDLDTSERLDAIPGTPPNLIYPPVGDAFAPRNKYAMKIDFEMPPPMFEISETHRAATWLLHPDAPHVDIPKTIRDRIERMKTRNGGGSDGE